jgi:hypothetical protein
MSSTNEDPAFAVTFFSLFSAGKSIGGGATDSHLLVLAGLIACLSYFRLILLSTTRKGIATGDGSTSRSRKGKAAQLVVSGDGGRQSQQAISGVITSLPSS